MNKIYLYGLADVSDKYRVVRYHYIEEDMVTIKDLRESAAFMRFRNPNVETVYAIDNRPGLAYDYKTTLKRNTIEGNVIFKDMLEREGIKII